MGGREGSSRNSQGQVLVCPKLDKLCPAKAFIVAGAATFALAVALFPFLARVHSSARRCDIALQSIRIPSTRLDQSLAMQRAIEKAIASPAYSPKLK